MPLDQATDVTTTGDDEYELLNNVPGFEDGDDNEATREAQSQGTGEQATNQPPGSTSQEQPTRTDQPPTGKTSDGNRGTQSGQQRSDLHFDLRRDEQGNIVDSKGQIVAEAGAARRQFEKQALDHINTANRLAHERQKEVDTLKQQLQNLQGLGSSAAQLGLNDNDALQAMKLYVSLRTDPMSVARNLLTNLRAAGHNIEGLGATTDLAAFKQMLSESLKPIASRFETQEQQTRQEQERIEYGRQEAEKFFSSYPDAEIHSQAIANVMNAELERGNAISPVDAYFRIYRYAVEQQLDFTQPLAPQIEARRANGERNPTQANAGENRVPLAGHPSGRAAANQGGMADPMKPPKDYIASADTSISEIVRSAMKDSGLNF